jgi:hypothetical protein
VLVFFVRSPAPCESEIIHIVRRSARAGTMLRDSHKDLDRREICTRKQSKASGIIKLKLAFASKQAAAASSQAALVHTLAREPSEYPSSPSPPRERSKIDEDE